MNNAALTTQLQLARGEDDGFDFLWRLFTLAIPILDRRQGVKEPTWPLDNDLFALVQSMERYNLLLAHHGPPPRRPRPQC